MAKGKPWTNDELETLRRLAAEGKSAREAAEIMGRTKQAINKRAEKEGFGFKNENYWTVEQEEMLIDLYDKGVYLDIIAAQMGKSKSAILMKAKRLNIKSQHKKRMYGFSEEDMQEMIEMYKDNVSMRKIAEHFGISMGTVDAKIKLMGGKRFKKNGRATRSDKTILPFDKVFRMYYTEKRSEDEIANIFGVSRGIVSRSLKHHGIVKISAYERRKMGDL